MKTEFGVDIKGKKENQKIERREFLMGAAATAAGPTALDTRVTRTASQPEPRGPAAARLFCLATAMPPRAQRLFPTEDWLNASSKANYSHQHHT